jgi:hypothetical protein
MKEDFERVNARIKRIGKERRVRFESPSRQKHVDGRGCETGKRRERMHSYMQAEATQPTIYILTFATDILPRRHVDKLLDEQLPARMSLPSQLRSSYHRSTSISDLLRNVSVSMD